MKSYSLLFPAILAGLWFFGEIGAFACSEGETRTTSTGATFTCASKPTSWGESWKDPSGAIWSATLQGAFDGWDGFDTSAGTACANIGGSLPTRDDYLRLEGYFGGGDGQALSAQGFRDLYAVFPDMKPSLYWTSTVEPLDEQIFSYGFCGNDGSVLDNIYRETLRYVRCAG